MDDAQRLAYEERREDERRQEREREEAYREELEQEDARRLARYDEAVRLLRMVSGMAVHWEPLTPGDISDVNRFLADEPKEGRG